MVFFFFVGGGPWSILISVAISLLSVLFRYGSSGGEGGFWDDDVRARPPPPSRPGRSQHRRGAGGLDPRGEGLQAQLPGLTLLKVALFMVLGVVACGALLLHRPGLARDPVSRQLLRLAEAARRGMQRLEEYLQFHFQVGGPPNAAGRRSTQRERAKRQEVSSLPVEPFTSEQELSRWGPTKLKDELRSLQISADMRLGRFSGGSEARETHCFLRAGGVVEKSELVAAVMKARGGESGLSCMVCLAEYSHGDQLRVLPCGHRFHCECVDKWLVDQSRTCPLCSKKI